jgi:hypothetical protein
VNPSNSPAAEKDRETTLKITATSTLDSGLTPNSGLTPDWDDAEDLAGDRLAVPLGQGQCSILAGSPETRSGKRAASPAA